MRFTIVTIFPELFSPFLETSIVGRAVEKGLIAARVVDLREYADDPHRVVDDEPFGGGGGMVMLAQPWLKAVRDLSGEDTRRVLLSPQGRPFSDSKARELALRPEVLLMCSRYEGIDERVVESVVDEEISMGDYVVSGGEIPAMAVVEAVARQIDGVVGCSDSVANDSFRTGLLDHPHFTRPRRVEGVDVPEVLVSGNHAAIARWREEEALRNTVRKRPDLIAEAELTGAQKALLAKLEAEEGTRAKLED